MKAISLAAVFAAIISSSLVTDAQEAGKTSVLFLHGAVTEHAPGQDNMFTLRPFLPDETLQAKMTEHGIVWGAQNFSTQMTWDYLKQFNVIVMLDFPIIEKHNSVKDAVREKEKLLARFVEEGGGVLFTGTTEYGMWGLDRNIEELNRFLEPFGATVLHEQVDEKNMALTLPSFGASRLAWTGNVAKHPLTEGVRGILYPLDFPWAYSMHPLKVNDPWQVLVRGTPTATTYSVKLGTGLEKSTRRPGACAAEPPLVAVRESGRGRMALWMVEPSEIIIDAYHPFWGGGLVMEGTNPDMPSDGRRLLFNLMDWLAATSRGKFGGYTPPAPPEIGVEPGFQQFNWDKVEIKGKQFPNAWRGIIGLRSNLSTGADSPQQMLAAAKEAGYDFAAFTEDLEKLTAEKLEALKKVCAENSSEKFQAYAGFAYRDESGNLWTTFGPQLTWPKDDWWSKNRPGAIVKNNMVFRGYQFVPVIMTKAGQNPEPAWFQGNFKGIALYTYEDAKPTDDSTDLYLKLQANGYDLFPTVVHEARSVEDVKAAAAAPHQAWVRWRELSDVASALSGTTAMYKGNHVFRRTAFVSAGPIIEDFRVFNFGTADLAIPGNDRYRIHLNVSSPKGLKEVALFDGEELYRRFLLSAEKEWTGDVDGYQDRDHHFIATATDIEGGKVVGSGCGTNVQELLLVRCTDNLNTYTSGKFAAVKFFALRGLESYIDRQAGAFYYFPKLPVPESERYAVEQQLPLVSRFGYVRRDVLEYFYPPTASPNWNANDLPDVAKPQTALRGAVTVTLFAPRANGTSAYLVEGDFTALRDLDLQNGAVPVYQGHWAKDAEVFYVAHKDGRGLCARLGRRKPHYTGTMKDVEYVAQMAPMGGSRALWPLTPNMRYSAMLGGDERCTLIASVDIDRPKLAKGDTFKYRYLAVWSAINPPPDNGFMEEVCDKLGLRGQTAYKVEPRIGSALDTKFALRLKAENGGFAGKITEAKLPMALPVYVEGLNPRWPAGILYKARNQLFVPTWRMDKVGNRYVEQVKTPGQNQLLRFPVLNGTGMLQVDTEIGDKDVFIGNLVTCDQPEVFLSLDDVRPGHRLITTNNPTDNELTCTIRPAPGFDLLGDFAKTVKIPAGGLVKINVN